LDMDVLKSAWQQTLSPVFDDATLTNPTTAGFQHGGKEGRHTEYMGYLLTEMHYLQRAYPNAVW
jgi:ring-1,2-phenylacetyl-CoA epoxidase subunit PaaC